MCSKKKRKCEDDSKGKRKKFKRSNIANKCLIHRDGLNLANFINFKENQTDTILKLTNTAKLRLKEPNDSPYCMTTISETFLKESQEIDYKRDGYHRSCYQYFTSNLNRLTGSDSNKDVSNQIKRSQRATSSKDTIIFSSDCIFCNKKGKKRIKKKGYFTTDSVTIFENGGGPKVITHAKDIDEKLFTRISGFDLFSCEAKYHPSCRINFMNTKRNIEAYKSSNIAKKIDQTECENVHRKAFNDVKDLIINEIIQKKRNN